MKLDRLLGIVTTLLQQDMVTAPYLAEQFEVSRRTINRDIEELCMAGIPVVTMQGSGGGISIASGYKLDKTLITKGEMQAILAGLKSLDSVSGSNEYKRIGEKFGQSPPTESDTVYDSSGHILINLASYYRGSIAPKIEMLKKSIEERHMVEFDYYCYSGEEHREVEPYVITFQWSSWYLYAYCKKREDFRLFKLNRMLDLMVQPTSFEGREILPLQTDIVNMYHDNIHLIAEFDTSQKWKLIDEYGPESFHELESGKLLFESTFENKYNLMSWILGFGDKVQILSPKSVIEEYTLIATNMIRKHDLEKM